MQEGAELAPTCSRIPNGNASALGRCNPKTLEERLATTLSIH